MPKPLNLTERINRKILYIEINGQNKPLDNALYTQTRLCTINVNKRETSLRVKYKDEDGFVSQAIIDGIDKGGVKRLIILDEKDFERVVKKEKNHAEIIVYTNGHIRTSVTNMGDEYSVHLQFAESMVFCIDQSGKMITTTTKVDTTNFFKDRFHKELRIELERHFMETNM